MADQRLPHSDLHSYLLGDHEDDDNQLNNNPPGRHNNNRIPGLGDGLHAAHQAILQQGAPVGFRSYHRPVNFPLKVTHDYSYHIFKYILSLLKKVLLIPANRGFFLSLYVFWLFRSFCWWSSCVWRCYWLVWSASHCRVSFGHKKTFYMLSNLLLYTSILSRPPLPLSQCVQVAGWCLSGWAAPWFMSSTRRPVVCTCAGSPFEPPQCCFPGCHRAGPSSCSKSTSGHSW